MRVFTFVDYFLRYLYLEYVTSNGKKNDELGRIWKEVLVT
jgi:hypothetical protein